MAGATKRDDHVSLGEVIRALRELNGMTRAELHRATAAEEKDRVSVEMLAKVEQGAKKPSLPTLRKITSALGVTPAAVFHRSNLWQLERESGVATVASLRSVALGMALSASPPKAGLVVSGLAGAMIDRRLGNDRMEEALRQQLATWIERAPVEDLRRAQELLRPDES